MAKRTRPEPPDDAMRAIAAGLRDFPREDFKQQLKSELQRKASSMASLANQVKPIPEGYHTATPYLIVEHAARALEFYKQAFGATELFRMEQPDGRIGHAEIKIGDSHVMLADEYPEMNMRGPKSLSGSPVTMHLYVEDVDAMAGKALAAGAKELSPVKDQFYGDRAGRFEDPFGHNWYIATHKEDLSPEEIGKRAKAAGF